MERLFRHTSRHYWPRVLYARAKITRASPPSGIISMFLGTMSCADCGEKLYYSVTNNYKQEQVHFFCSAYRKNSDVCLAHYICEVVVEKLVLANMQRVFNFTKSRLPRHRWLTMKRNQKVSCGKTKSNYQSQEAYRRNWQTDTKDLWGQRKRKAIRWTLCHDVNGL